MQLSLTEGALAVGAAGKLPADTAKDPAPALWFHRFMIVHVAKEGPGKYAGDPEPVHLFLRFHRIFSLFLPGRFGR